MQMHLYVHLFFRALPVTIIIETAVLAGLNLTEEYLRLQEDYQQLLAMVKQVR